MKNSWAHGLDTNERVDGKAEVIVTILNGPLSIISNKIDYYVWREVP